MKKNLEISFENYHVTFSPESGGFPAAMTQLLRRGKSANVLDGATPWLLLKLRDGRTAVPYLPEEMEPLVRQDEDGTVFLLFSGIPMAAEGKTLPEWALDMDYELHADGVGFLHTTLTAVAQNKPAVAEMKLRIPMDLGDEQDVTYSYWLRPKELDGGEIQAYSRSIFNCLTEKETRKVEGTLLPYIHFEFGQGERLFRSVEWMVENQSSLDEDDPFDTDTTICWTERGPVVEYDLTRRGIKDKGMPYYWTNRIGFSLTQTPKVRRKAPLCLYHNYDSFEYRYPTDEQIARMAAEGADMLILHEAWRSDGRNGGAPRDLAEFRRVIDTCHRHGIRVAPYTRGNEDSNLEYQCSWFRYFFQKDFDGLYVDYGGPLEFLEVSGIYPGGRINFHRNYHAIRAMREMVGEDGVIILHIGPFFGGAVIAGLVDAFISGECEQGVLLDSRKTHTLFTKAEMAPGALGTASFPAYRTERIFPHEAISGQFPHVSLGQQVKSSSLVMPYEPGNLLYMRPLWRYFGLMKGEKNVGFTNDICDEALRTDCFDTGVSEYTMEDGSRLLLMANFADHARACTAQGFDRPAEGQSCWFVRAAQSGCTAEKLTLGERAEAELPAYGVCGWLLCPDNDKWQKRLAAFISPYPAKSAADIAYEEKIEAQRKLRFEPEEMQHFYLRLHVPFFGITWEPPLWDDLYETLYKLFITTPDGVKKELGYVSLAGLTKDEPDPEDRQWAGETSPWICLDEYLPAGRSSVEIHAYRVDEDYYSCVEAQLAESPDGEAKTFTFYGELDENRSRLTFDVKRG